MRFFLLTLFFLFGTPAFAADTDKASEPGSVTFLSQEELDKNRALITRLEKYLSGLTTIVADFSQVAPDGSLTNGKFYLQRPGRMLWLYNPPTPILMVADGKELIFYDYELEQETHILLNSTMIGFMAKENITFDGFVAVTELEQAAGVIRVKLVEREKPRDGSLMLEFSDNPLQIKNMIITDATNQRTSVSLQRATFGVVLDKELFVFNPKKRRRKT